MNWEIILYISLMISMLGIGWLGNDVYRDLTNKRIIDGLYLRNYNWSSARETAYQLDNLGDFVCVNIRGISYERAIEVINHEVGHEIFAEECEKNIDKCMEVVEK